MRNLIAVLVAWFRPVRGRLCTKLEPTPAVRIVQLPPSRPFRPAECIDADSLPLVPRYLVHHERVREAHQQRERRRALALASMGQDYVPERAA